MNKEFNLNELVRKNILALKPYSSARNEYAGKTARVCIDAKKELFNLRFQNATNQLDNTARITEVRKNIARIQTVITVKKNEVNA